MNSFLLFLTRIIFLSGVMMLFPSICLGQCDNSLTNTKYGAASYSPRSNRCEGFYSSPVSANYLQLIGFTEGEFRFKPVNEEVITVSVSTTENQNNTSAFIKAVGAPIDLYYRMDAVLAGGNTLEWPVREVLLRDDRTTLSRNIGLLAYQKNGGQNVYLPVTANSKLLGKANSKRQILTFRSSKRLDQVIWRLDNEKNYRMGIDRDIPRGQVFRIVLPENLVGSHFIEILGREHNKLTHKIPLSFFVSI